MTAHQKSIGTCLFCVPLHYGVALIALASCMHALLCLVQFFTHDVRLQSGGYNPHTLHLQVTVGVAGLIFAPLGLLGVFDSKVPWIRAFYNFQVAKLVVLVLVFAADLVTLRRCEGWADSLEAQTHPNTALYAMSVKGTCAMARFYYIVGFAADLCVNAYFARATRELHERLEACPAYMIRFGGGGLLAPAGGDHTQVKFYDHSLGEPIQYLGPVTFRPAELLHGKSHF